MVRRILSFIMVFVFVSAACSFGTTATSTPASTEVKSASTATLSATSTESKGLTKETPVKETPTESGTVSGNTDSGAAKTLDDVKAATIQIAAEGTFMDPQVGLQLNIGHLGSGFIIDPSGIAVTNNHVVTGAASLVAYIGGSKEAKHVRVIGASECSDLAVIQIEGGPYPYLAFNYDAAKVGTDVYAAGFPLGDPEFTLTHGIISKAKASGDTDWSAVENVIEHDATIRPGNSGGPLVNNKGQVVGINYASGQAGPYYAIAPTEAKSIIDQMKAGKDVNSIGINGVAIADDKAQIYGIWVRSVKSGSPADKTGVKAGDIITQVENVVVSTDGTMSAYCNILRSHQPTDTLAVTVLRFADLTLLTGEVNGRQLAVSKVFTPSGDTGSTTNTPAAATSATGDYTQFVKVTDTTGAIEVEVPAEWADVNGGAWNTTWGSQNISAPSITASTNVDNFDNTWDESGVFVTASSDLGRTGGYIELLDGVRGWFDKDCKLDSTKDLVNSEYQGKYQIWKSCGPNKTVALVVVARPQVNSTSHLVLMILHITKDADANALDHILSSFVVKGSV